MRCEHFYVDLSRTASLTHVRAKCMFCQKLFLFTVAEWDLLVAQKQVKAPDPSPPFIGRY